MGNFISNSHKDADLLLLKTGGTPESLIIDFRTLYYIYVNHSDLSDNGVSHQILTFPYRKFKQHFSRKAGKLIKAFIKRLLRQYKWKNKSIS